MSALTTEAPRSSRGGRPRDPSRDGVIRAAILSLLADVGYGALTMDAVAAEAGVGKATIYRRWRTKEDLVVDTISEITRSEVSPTDTGSLEGDLREMLHTIVGVVNGPIGAATQALLSTVPHHPALAAAFRDGPIGVWRQAFDEIFARAEARGEVRPGLSNSVLAEAITAPLVQRWLVNGRPVTEDYADEVLREVVLPLLRTAGAPTA
jgi:AcrR family transcriptional regulator